MCERSLNRFGRIDSKSTSNLLRSSVNAALVTVNLKLLGVLLSVSSDVESEDSGVCEHLLTKGSLLCSVTDLSAYCMPKTLPCTIGSTLSQSYIYIYLQGEVRGVVVRCVQR